MFPFYVVAVGMFKTPELIQYKFCQIYLDLITKMLERLPGEKPLKSHLNDLLHHFSCPFYTNTHAHARTTHTKRVFHPKSFFFLVFFCVCVCANRWMMGIWILSFSYRCQKRNKCVYMCIGFFYGLF